MTTVRPTLSANRVDNDIVTNADYNRDVLQNMNWLQEVIAGNNPDEVPLSAITGEAGSYENILDNGGFEIWNRGAGAFTTGQTSDRWAIFSAGGSTISVTRAAAGMGGGSAFELAGTYTHVGGGNCQMIQAVEQFEQWRGRTLFFRGSALTNVNACGYVIVYDGVTLVTTARTGNNVQSTLTCSLTVAANATQLTVQYVADTASHAFIIDNFTLVASTVAPTSYQEQTAAYQNWRCSRYWQQLQCSGRETTRVASQVFSRHVNYPTPMDAAPTVTLTAGTRNNISAASVVNINADDLEYQLTGNLTATDTYAVRDIVTLERNL